MSSCATNLVSAPVSDIDQLLRVLGAADQNLPKESVTFSLLFRGQDSDLPLSPKGLSGDMSAKVRALKRTAAAFLSKEIAENRFEKEYVGMYLGLGNGKSLCGLRFIVVIVA